MRSATVLALLIARAVWGATEPEEKLIGWKGDTFKPVDPQKRPWVENVAWSPRAFIFHNFLSDAEAQHIVDLAGPQMQRSTVVGANGSSVLDDYRTSYGTFLSRYQDEVIRSIQDRIALYTHTPVAHQEDMQVLRYGIGQYYHRHQDSLDNDSPRMATLLVYLSDPEYGGETVFPEQSRWVNPVLEKTYGSEFSQCGRGHVGIMPRRGDGLLFWSYGPDGKTSDIASTHEGCPVLAGAKWTTTIWIHTKPFRPYEYNAKTNKYRYTPPFRDPGVCFDSQGTKDCSKWAAAGECDKNSVYMRGDSLTVGNCMKACGVCRVCDYGDQVCFAENRRRLGFLTFNQSELDYRRPPIGSPRVSLEDLSKRAANAMEGQVVTVV